jgi:hypothetical protein
MIQVGFWEALVIIAVVMALLIPVLVTLAVVLGSRSRGGSDRPGERKRRHD